MEAGNAFLDKTYIAELNERYTLEAGDPVDAHRVVDRNTNLAEALREQERHVAGRDWCVRWENAYLQIAAEHEKLALPGKQVIVKSMRDGMLVMEHQGQPLKGSAVKQRPEPPKEKRPIKNNKPWKPSKSHPWNSQPSVAASGGRDDISASVQQTNKHGILSYLLRAVILRLPSGRASCQPCLP